jgi:hypothetical protein
MLATYKNSVATEEDLRFALRYLAAPILGRKRTMSLTFLFVVSVTLLLGQTQFHKSQSPTTALPYTISLPSFIPLLPAHISAVTILLAIILGLLIGLSLTYLVDYRDPCFHSPAQVIRTLRIPLVVAIPKRTP